MKTYEIQLKHDAGEVIIRTRATDISAAKVIVCAAERCPPSAIGWWRIVPTPCQIKRTQNLMRGL